MDAFSIVQLALSAALAAVAVTKAAVAVRTPRRVEACWPGHATISAAALRYCDSDRAFSTRTAQAIGATVVTLLGVGAFALSLTAPAWAASADSAHKIRIVIAIGAGLIALFQAVTLHEWGLTRKETEKLIGSVREMSEHGIIALPANLNQRQAQMLVRESQDRHYAQLEQARGKAYAAEHGVKLPPRTDIHDLKHYVDQIVVERAFKAGADVDR